MQDRKNVAKGSDTLGELERAVALGEEAKAELLRILEWNVGEAQELELHEVERHLLRSLLAIGRTLLRGHLARRGSGKAGGEVLRKGVPLPYSSTKSRAYLSIFGELKIERAYFWKKGSPGVFPLDAELNLPELRYSYLLQEFGELIGVGQAYDRVSEYLQRLLGVRLWKQGAQKIAKQAGKGVQAYYEAKGPPPPDEEAELLVVAVDGKGVPMRRQLPPRKLQEARGPKKDKKREAVVSAIYSVARNRRSAENLLQEIDEAGYICERSEESPKRPKPQHKRVRATMEGKAAAFVEIRRALEERDPEGRKEGSHSRTETRASSGELSS